MGLAVRTEHDSLGAISVPADALYGASTARAVQNFPVSGETVPYAIIHVLAAIKADAARVNGELKQLDPHMAQAIAHAAERIVAGECMDQFPVDVFQTGSGTSTNMNVNEVIAHLASDALASVVHPNDHVNCGQSSNDTFPTAIHIAVAVHAHVHLLPALRELAEHLGRKATQFRQLWKTGRTHLQDAVPLTLGQEFGGYAAQVTHAAQRVEQSLQDVLELPLGGTAVGSGITAHPQFAMRVIHRLSQRFGLPFREPENRFEAQAARDALAHVSAALRGAAVSLSVVANNIRWLAADPLGEITLPALQPGSSIMPGKVNPVLCESLLQVCAQVLGNDAAVVQAALMSNFQINTGMPLLARNILESIRLLTNATRAFSDGCVQGITANAQRMKERLGHNLMLVTALAPHIGYDHAAQIAHRARADGTTVRQAAIAEGMEAMDVDRYLASMIGES